METVLIAGGTGMVGTALSKELVKSGYRVIILTRQPGKYHAGEGIDYAGWDSEKQFIDDKAWNNADHIINLSGANVMEKRWSPAFKNEILESRVKGNRLIAKKISESNGRIKSFITASAIGWYGPDLHNEHPFKEDAPANSDFLGSVCKQWEESSQAAEAYTRVCRLRIGIVLSKEGGFIETMLSPINKGLAPIPGNGKQVMSWIHIQDLCRMFIFTIQQPLKGSYNAVAPNPERLKDIVILLATKKRKRFFIPAYAPAFILKIMLGERSIEILKSTTVSSDKITSEGFSFLYPSITTALDEII
jgi:uncharacterized protein (TIGR01777 family)